MPLKVVKKKKEKTQVIHLYFRLFSCKSYQYIIMWFLLTANIDIDNPYDGVMNVSIDCSNESKHFP